MKRGKCREATKGGDLHRGLHCVQNDRLFDYCHVVNSELNNLLARVI